MPLMLTAVPVVAYVTGWSFFAELVSGQGLEKEGNQQV
jgi:hypothetical protein